MENKNAILFSYVDREDYWVCNGLVFKVKNTETYEDAFNEIKSKLETPEMIGHIIENGYLEADLFRDDETFKFVKVEYNHGLNVIFSNSQGEHVYYEMSADFVFLA